MSPFRPTVLPLPPHALPVLLLSVLIPTAAASVAAQTAPPDTSRHAAHGAPRAGRDTTRPARDRGSLSPSMGAMSGVRASDTTHAAMGHAAAGHAAMGPGMHAMMSGPLGLPMTRTGSGTAWVPDSTPMYARMFEAGAWGLMFHGVAFGQYDHQGGPRGANQVGSVNWGMLMAARNLGRTTADGGSTGGRLQLRGMVSLEPFTVGSRGYPLLLQTGEAYQGRPLHDRQHPHDLFMELAALYEKPLAKNLGLQLYAAPVGEPALGPVAFPHRPSAASDPFATLGHHWQDATHISFGVLTAGLFTRTVKLEGSVFNGREPDEIRTNFDYKGRSLDSYAGRLSVNPSPYVSLSAAYGYLKSPEALHPEESQHRTTLSALYGRPFRAHGTASVSALYGVNRHAGAAASPSGGVEGLLDLDGTNTVFARVERSRKTAEELVLPTTGSTHDAPGAATGAASGAFDPSRQFSLGSLSLGYVREVVRGVGLLRGASLGLGVEGTVNRVPTSLVPTYGSRTPRGFAVYLRLRPSRMSMGMGAIGMDGMMGHEAGRPSAHPMSHEMPPGAMPTPTDSAGRTPPRADTTSMPGMGMPQATAQADSTSRVVPRATAPTSPAAKPSPPARSRQPSSRTSRPATRDSMPGMAPSGMAPGGTAPSAGQGDHGRMPGVGTP